MWRQNVRKADIEAIGDLAGEALAAGPRLIQEMHQGIAGRPLDALGVAAAPARVIHDAVASSVYRGLQRGFAAVARQTAGLWARTAEDEGPGLGRTTAGLIGLATLNGLYGDRIRRRESPLALRMEIRQGGRAVARSPEDLGRAFPGAASQIVVFLHGLFETEQSWQHFPLGGDRERRRSYGARLQEELGITPVQIRYNTGLHVSDNGRELARLMEEVVEAWPVPITQIVLIGHSMGGLVARSACHYGHEAGHRWIGQVGHVFCLGTPHLGADLEKGLNALGSACSRLPETRGLASLVNLRSAGIKDLRFGSCVEEDWCACDPDEFLRDRCREVPFLADAHYYFIAATLTEGPVGGLLGDLLVRIPSASGRGSGRGRRIPFEVDHGCEFSGMTHFDLLNHPSVYEQLRSWITAPVVASPVRV
jgi:pimeloyl-ACP methyl ester carboxylesterase